MEIRSHDALSIEFLQITLEKDRLEISWKFVAMMLALYFIEYLQIIYFWKNPVWNIFTYMLNHHSCTSGSLPARARTAPKHLQGGNHGLPSTSWLPFVKISQYWHPSVFIEKLWGSNKEWNKAGFLAVCWATLAQRLQGKLSVDESLHLEVPIAWLCWSKFHSWLCISWLHPWKSTGNIIMEVWKIIFFSKWVICRFHVNLPGRIYILLPCLENSTQTKRYL